MPFIMRQVQPVSLARVEKGDEASDGPIDSLADIQIRVLTNIIEQLGDISHHASEIINNIGEECEKINKRTEKITSRVSAVQKTVDEMKVEEKTPVMIDEQGVSSDLTDGNLFTPESRPKIITEKYLKADPMPNLEALQQYRDDDKQSKSFYSFPGYFFELWKAQFQEAARIEKEKRKEERRERKRNRAEKPKRNIVSYVRLETKADRIRKKMEEEGKIMAQGPNVISQNISFDFETLPSVPDEIFRSNVDTAEHSILSIMDNDTSSISPSSVISPPETLISSPLPSSTIPPPPGPVGITDSHVSMPATSISPVPPAAPSFSGPPPPPAPSGPPPPPPPSTGGPPPPPGPPLLPGTAGPSVSPAPVQKASGNLSMMEQLQQAKLKTASKVEQAPKSVDTRSDLLTQIQMGRNLKKVQKTEKVMNKRMSGIAGVFEDAMKSRREHFESDDEDDYDSDSSSEWDD